MARKKISKAKKEKFTLRFILALALFLLLSIIIPAIGAEADAPQLWIEIVAFFQSVQDHIMQFWMIYTLATAAMVAYLNKK